MYRIGQLVVCIRDFSSRRPLPGEVFPTKGMVYTVRDIVDGKLVGNNKTYIRLEEIVNPIEPRYGYEPAFHVLNFRPVKPTSIEVFNAMLKPVKEDA